MKSGKIRTDDGVAAVVTYGPSPNSGIGALHLPGLPNNPYPIAGISEFLARRYFVLQPHYFGSYDSTGHFDPVSSFENVPYWLSRAGQALRDYAARSDILLPESWPVCSAHSFGSYVLMQALFRSTATFKLALIFAPMFAFGEEAETAGLRLDLVAHATYVESAFPLTFRVPRPGAMHQFFRARTPYVADTSKPPTPCLFIVGEQDPMLDAKQVELYIRRFCERNSTVVRLVDVIRVPGGAHDVSGMLTPSVQRSIDMAIETYCRSSR